MGQIRLQWWRESLAGIYDGTPREHAVVEPLARAVAAKDLPRELLEAVIDAREFDLRAEPPEDLEALRAYAEGTSTTLLRAALRILRSEDAASGGDSRGKGAVDARAGTCPVAGETG